jgi:hypothetical protein
MGGATIRSRRKGPIGRGLIAAFAALISAGCNAGLGAFQTGVGNTPNRPPGVAYRFLGQVGMPFSAVVSDTQESWAIQGTLPLNVIIENNDTPVRVVATKQSSSAGILSVELTVGFTVFGLESTTQPYGVVTLQSGSTAPGFAPPPPFAGPNTSPDVRFYVRAPLGERFAGLVEDTANAYEVSDRVPALILFEDPNGGVDATFNQVQNFGPFEVTLYFNGVAITCGSGGPTLTIKQGNPPCGNP